ncbi:MAG: NADH(P)-binding protein [Nakamurella sp.]
MRVAIVGGGNSGEAIARAVRERGGDAILLSRSTGFDVLDDAAPGKFHASRETDGGIDVFVEATGSTAASANASAAFFGHSTRTVAAAAGMFGARHILLSIVGCYLPAVQGFGYYAGKTAQERIAREASENLTIVRSTQWFEFGQQMLQRLGFGLSALVPSMRIQPIAMDSVADTIASCALEDGHDDVLEVAGPEVMTLRELVRRLPHRPPVVLPLAIPSQWGRAFRNGTLLPSSSAIIMGPTLDEWLAQHAATLRP